MTANVAALRAELEWITAHPARWDQNTWCRPPATFHRDAADDEWHCGTVACLAGWTALHAGYRPVAYDGVDVELPVTDVARRPDAVGVGARVPLPVEHVARRLLGLTPAQAALLFDGGNSLRDLWEFARVFTDGELTVPADVVARSATWNFEPDDEDRYRAADAPDR